MKKYALILILPLLLIGCGPSTKKLEVYRKPTPRIELSLPKVDKFDALPVKWNVLPDRAWLSIRDYQHYLLNRKGTLKLISQQRTVINAYREFYKSQDKTDIQ